MKLRALLVLVSLFTVACAAKSSSPLKVGDDAPLVSGTTETGATLALGDVYAKSPYTLVYFYPRAGTAGCTAQGCSLRDAYEALTDRGVTVVGVSTDTVEAQRAFKADQHFPFTLIADQDRKVIDAFGVPTRPGTNAAARQAFLIKGGKIVWADYAASTDRQAVDVLRVISAQ